MDQKIVLIDDDRFFGYTMLEYARDQGLDLEYYESLSDLGFLGGLGRFRAAIVDFHLQSMTGIEIAEYLDRLFGDIPMVLISSDGDADLAPKPGCVQRFVHKSEGVERISAAVREVLAAASSSRDAAPGRQTLRLVRRPRLEREGQLLF